MPDDLVILATFPTPSEAGFFRSLLESEGIPSYLGDDATVGIHPLLGNTIGWVKLQVAAHDLDRAVELLEARKSDAEKMSPEEFAALALEDEPAEGRELELKSPPEQEPESHGADEAEDPLEELARRAFRASVIGLAFFPLLPYAAWVLGRLIFSGGEWSARTSRNAWAAAAVLTAFAGVVCLFVMSRP